jgi:chromosome segregation ATPase
LKRQLADSEEKGHSNEQAYAALNEKFRFSEASLKELASKLEDQTRLYDAAFKEITSRVEEKIQSDAAAFADVISRAEKKVLAGEAAYSELAKKMEESESALKERELVSSVNPAREFVRLNNRQELDSLRNTIQTSVTCGVCQGIPVQPCR